jgi:hypothetical protein
MLFADIDWNQVLMKGLIGGVIGGVVGLVMYLVKKGTGADKESSGDEPRKKKRDR